MTFNTQLRTLYTLKLYIANHGFSPTVRELATLRQMSVHGVYTHLRALAERGYISSSPGKWRNLELTEKGMAA